MTQEVKRGAAVRHLGYKRDEDTGLNFAVYPVNYSNFLNMDHVDKRGFWID